MTTIVVTQEGMIKLACRECGAAIWRKAKRKEGALCEKCHRKRERDRSRRKRGGFDVTYKLECTGCGKTVYRKKRRNDAKCDECKRMKQQSGNGQPKISSCDNCPYRVTCEKEKNMVAVVPGEGIVIMPLRCFAEHPLYDPAEWGRNGVQAQD